MSNLVTRGFGNQDRFDSSIVTKGLGGLEIDLGGTVLNALSLLDNIKRSLDKYMQSNIYGTEGISIDYEGLPFDNIKAGISWVKPRIVEIENEYLRQGSETQYGESVNITYQMSIYSKKSGVTITDQSYLIRDTIANYFKVGEDIPLENLVAGSSNDLANMRVRDILLDGPLPDDMKFQKYVIEWLLNFTRLTTNPN